MRRTFVLAMLMVFSQGVVCGAEDSKAERAAALACAFSVPNAPVMPAAFIAASRWLWMTRKAPA